MARLLKDLTINDVSTVDRGAGENVRVLLIKRYEEPAKPDDNSNVIDVTDLFRKKPDPSQETTMTPVEIAKMIEDAVQKQAKISTEAAAVEIKKRDDQLTAQALEISILKMSPDAQAFYKALPEEKRAAFAAKKKEDQDKEMDDCKKAAESTIPDEIKKQLAQAAEDRVQLNKLLERQEVSDFEKKATDIGLAKDKGEVLRKAWKGDAAAQAEVETLIKAANDARDAAQKAGGIFKELGGNGGNTGATAYDQLKNLAVEFGKSAEGQKLTPEQCFDKVMTDPKNAELAKLERDERMAKVAKVAA